MLITSTLPVPAPFALQRTFAQSLKIALIECAQSLGRLTLAADIPIISGYFYKSANGLWWRLPNHITRGLGSSGRDWS